jgi:hypothetical protein
MNESLAAQDVITLEPVDLGEGLQYVDLRQGGGPAVQTGFLTVMHFRLLPARLCPLFI